MAHAKNVLLLGRDIDARVASANFTPYSVAGCELMTLSESESEASPALDASHYKDVIISRIYQDISLAEQRGG